MYVAFRYDANGCWSDLTRIWLDEADQLQLNGRLDVQVIELDDDFIETCPAGVARELQKVRPRLSHLTAVPDLSYFYHDCRELSLMLAGEKPFASFHLAPGEQLEDAMWRPQPFDRYVEQGRIFRYETSFERDPNKEARAVLFALPGEEWRCRAYEMLFLNSLAYGFSIYNEPMFGTLWGYTDEQNREFMQLEAKLRGFDLKL